MKDPVRLLDEGATAAELSLLRAGMSEEPSEQSAQRLATLLGLAGGAAAFTTATKSSAAGAVARGAASKMAAKWLVLGALGVAGGAAIVFAARPGAHEAPRRGAGAPAAHRVDESRVAPVPTALPGEGAQTPQAEAARALPAEATVSPIAQDRASEGSARASTPSIAREIAALDVARRLLGSGNPRGALGALDDYEAQAKTGMLRQEATLLRIEALAGAGETSAARRLAHRFLQNHPHSPHENRVRALVGESP
jgi:hypothetical protein